MGMIVTGLDPNANIAVSNMSKLRTNLVGTLNYVGTYRPGNPSIGDVYTDIEHDTTYVYNGIEWAIVGSSYPKTKECIKTVCDNCGGRLPISRCDDSGLVECVYCSTIHQVWRFN